MSTPAQYQQDPKDYLYDLAEQGIVAWEFIAVACIKSMSTDRVKQMIKDNELTPQDLINE
jgi:hypothetical protein